MNLPTPSWSTYPAQAAVLQWTGADGSTNTIAFDIVETETWQEDATVTEHPVEVGANIGDHVRVALRTCELKVFSSNEPLGGSTPNGASAVQTTVPLTVPLPTWQGGSNTLFVPHWNNLIELRALAGALIGLGGGARGVGGQIGALAALEASQLLLPPFESIKVVVTDAGLVNVPPPGVPTATVEMQPVPQDFVLVMHSLLTLLKDEATIFSVIGSKGTCLAPANGVAGSGMVIEKLSLVRDVDTGTGESITIGLKEIRVVATQRVASPIANLPAGGGVPPVNRGAQTPVPVQDPEDFLYSAVGLKRPLTGTSAPGLFQ
jgi:hypothetical protein